MSEINEAAVRAWRQRTALAAVYDPRAPNREFADHTALCHYAAQYLGEKTPVIFFEFGVAGGKSIRAFADRLQHAESRFVGFDSFEGLPEPWLMHRRGSFSTEGRIPATSDPRISFVRGWFQNTLPDYLSNTKLCPEYPFLVHYDADLYSSGLFILSTLWHFLPEYYLILADFQQDDVIALHDFSKAYPVQIEFYGKVLGGNGKPSRVFGKITRSVFQPNI